jgi:hypothetical protein
VGMKYIAACKALRSPMAWFHLPTDCLYAHVCSTKNLTNYMNSQQHTRIQGCSDISYNMLKYVTRLRT